MTVLFAVVLTADLARYSLALSRSVFEFDGRRWWRRAGGEAMPLEMLRAGYAGPLLLSIRLEGRGLRRNLLLWRWQCGRESWRRLSLASRYGATGSTQA